MNFSLRWIFPRVSISIMIRILSFFFALLCHRTKHFDFYPLSWWFKILLNGFSFFSAVEPSYALFIHFVFSSESWMTENLKSFHREIFHCPLLSKFHRLQKRAFLIGDNDTKRCQGRKTIAISQRKEKFAFIFITAMIFLFYSFLSSTTISFEQEFHHRCNQKKFSKNFCSHCRRAFFIQFVIMLHETLRKTIHYFIENDKEEKS